MSKLKIALLLVFSSGQICGSQIFGGGGLNRPQGMPRGGILNPDGAARMGGGILGGHGIGTFSPKEFPSLFRHRPGHSLGKKFFARNEKYYVGFLIPKVWQILNI